MDILTTNWTDKIKSNPVANSILNTNHVVYTRVLLDKVLRSERQIQNTGYGTEIILDAGLPRQVWYDKDGAEYNDMKKNIPDEQNAINAFRYLTDQTRRRGGDVGRVFVPYHIDMGNHREVDEQDYWANTYVQDYINIEHPKERLCYVSALSSAPLQIKPPSVFFSDV